METTNFSEAYLTLQANRLAQKARRLKIAKRIDYFLLFIFMVQIFVFAMCYNGGYMTYDVSSHFCVSGLLCSLILSIIAHHLPYQVRVEEKEISQALETFFLNKEAALKEEIAEAKEESMYAEGDFKDKRRKLFLAKEALKQLLRNKKLK